MFEKKKTKEKVAEQEQGQEQEPADAEYDEAQDERANRLRDRIQSENKWDTKGLKPNTRRKKIGIALLVIGLVGYLLLQYVIRGG